MPLTAAVTGAECTLAGGGSVICGHEWGKKSSKSAVNPDFDVCACDGDGEEGLSLLLQELQQQL